ncbi:MAG: glycosyltransferase, partial [Eubacterium sp.]|nr:glycosyltransferase [Eubacterium sp.]
MNAKIIIVMAAYNGGSHIQKQIDSILAQTHTNWELWIRDDGSSDHTVDVIRSCAASDPRIHLFEDSRGNLGPQESFYTLLSGCPSADYYAFCDQDDLWVPEKLEWAAEMLSQEEKRGRQKAAASGQASELSRQTAKSSEQPGTSSVPIVYVASHDYLTENGTLLRRFPEQKTPITLYKVICHSVGSGFTMVLNDAA